MDQSYARAGPRMTASRAPSAREVAAGPDSRPHLRVVYFFSGHTRKASIKEHLEKLAVEHNVGVTVTEVDIMVGGSGHDLLAKAAQDGWIERIDSGEFDAAMWSPPCGTWSRSTWANDDGPPPCRDRAHPWGFPGALPNVQRRAGMGNEFIHFTLRGIASTTAVSEALTICRSLWEHPEDLGRTPANPSYPNGGTPASVWQLKETRKAFKPGCFETAAGYQCQFSTPDDPVDRAKPTRLLGTCRGFTALERRAGRSSTRTTGTSAHCRGTAATSTTRR